MSRTRKILATAFLGTALALPAAIAAAGAASASTAAATPASQVWYHE